MQPSPQTCRRCGRPLVVGDHAACRPAWAPVLLVLAGAALVAAAAVVIAH
jgi:hypothetical protein